MLRRIEPVVGQQLGPTGAVVQRRNTVVCRLQPEDDVVGADSPIRCRLFPMASVGVYAE